MASDVMFSGSSLGVEDGQEVTVIAAGLIQTAVVTNETFTGTLNLSSALNSDEMLVSATVTDIAGNLSESFTTAITLDTSAPRIVSLVIPSVLTATWQAMC